MLTPSGSVELARRGNLEEEELQDVVIKSGVRTRTVTQAAGARDAFCRTASAGGAGFGWPSDEPKFRCHEEISDSQRLM